MPPRATPATHPGQTAAKSAISRNDDRSSDHECPVCRRPGRFLDAIYEGRCQDQYVHNCARLRRVGMLIALTNIRIGLCQGWSLVCLWDRQGRNRRCCRLRSDAHMAFIAVFLLYNGSPSIMTSMVQWWRHRRGRNSVSPLIPLVISVSTYLSLSFGADVHRRVHRLLR